MTYLKGISKIRYDDSKCTGCGRCVEVCPHAVFELDGRKAALLWKDRCMECGACMKNCASGAVEVDSGVGCAFALINAMITGGEPSCDCSGTPTGGTPTGGTSSGGGSCC